MGEGKEWMADYMFESDFPFGLPGDAWTTADRREIKLTDMTTPHILNCMKLVGKDDRWYATFEIEMKRRKETNYLADCGCGSKAERIRLGYQKAVACVRGCAYTGWCDTQEEADAKWNRSRGIKEDTCCH